MNTKSKNPKIVYGLLTILLVLAGIYRLGYLYFLSSDPVPYQAVECDIYDQSRFMALARDILHPAGQDSTRPGLYCPFYSYLIALIFKLFGQRLFNVFIFQSIIGLLSVYLIFLAARDLYHSHSVGLIAAGLMGLYSPLVFYEGTLLRAALIAYSNLAAFYFLLKGCRESKPIPLAAGGVLLAISFLLRQHILPFFVLGYLLFQRQWAWPKKLSAAWAYGLAFFLVATPFTFNSQIATPQKQTSAGLSAFWIGNTYDSSGVGLWRSPLRNRFAREAQGSVRKTLSILWREIQAHPGSYAQLYMRKIYMFLNAYETPANLSFDLYLGMIPFLRMGIFTYWFILPWAIIGLIVGDRKFPQISALHLFILVLSLYAILFHIQGRYRIPVIPFFILPAAFGIRQFLSSLQSRHYSAIIGIIMGILSLSILVAPDMDVIRTYFGGVIRPYDYTNWAIAKFYQTQKKENQLSVAEKRRICRQMLDLIDKHVQTPTPLLGWHGPKLSADKVWLRRQALNYLQDTRSD